MSSVSQKQARSPSASRQECLPHRLSLLPVVGQTFVSVNSYLEDGGDCSALASVTR